MTKPKLRCAIYTRKSSEEGLDQEFNSLHAQREACEAYIKSQASEGWSLIKTKYDDGGYSGGNMERPGLKALLGAIEASEVDIIVVYKVDRLTRSLADFAKIIERLDAKKASFVSVTQSFNTTTSMGRLTLNVLLSFAQFEREVTGERIRDKLAASKKKGLWMGGNLPLGYDADGRTLRINEAEAETVRAIFKRYVELKSVYVLAQELTSQGIKSKEWISTRGRKMGGFDFERGALRHLLQNPLYTGQIRHKDKVYPGQHKAIVSQKLWDEVQKTFAGNRVERIKGKADAREEYWLTGKIFDAVGRPMTPSYTVRPQGRRYKYYAVRAALYPKPAEEPTIVRVQMEMIHELVGVATVRHLNSEIVGPALHDCIRNVAVEQSKISIEAITKAWKGGANGEEVGNPAKGMSHKIEVPVTVAKRGGRSEIIPPHDLQISASPSPQLVHALRQAWQWRQMIETGKYASVDVLAKTEGVSARQVNKMLPLGFLDSRQAIHVFSKHSIIS